MENHLACSFTKHCAGSSINYLSLRSGAALLSRVNKKAMLEPQNIEDKKTVGAEGKYRHSEDGWSHYGKGAGGKGVTDEEWQERRRYEEGVVIKNGGRGAGRT